MYLIINTPEGLIFEEKIEKVVVPTEQLWEICILNNHQPLISVVKPGIIRIKPQENQKNEFITGTKFLFEDEWIHISTGSGFIYVNENKVAILTSVATTKIETDEQVLEQMKADMQKQIQEIQIKWSADEVERAFLYLQKITADLRLSRTRKRM